MESAMNWFIQKSRAICFHNYSPANLQIWMSDLARSIVKSVTIWNPNREINAEDKHNFILWESLNKTLNLMGKKLRKSKMVAIKVMWSSRLFEKEEKKSNLKAKKVDKKDKTRPKVYALANVIDEFRSTLLICLFFFYGKYSLLRLFPIILRPS